VKLQITVVAVSESAESATYTSPGRTEPHRVLFPMGSGSPGKQAVNVFER